MPCGGTAASLANESGPPQQLRSPSIACWLWPPQAVGEAPLRSGLLPSSHYAPHSGHCQLAPPPFVLQKEGGSCRHHQHMPFLGMGVPQPRQKVQTSFSLLLLLVGMFCVLLLLLLLFK